MKFLKDLLFELLLRCGFLVIERLEDVEVDVSDTVYVTDDIGTGKLVRLDEHKRKLAD